ncbi:MAG: cytidylate kinase-like family protein [Treponema sp.]|nr:cytidylate kinase-like family protein [Treponema sp.]
MKKIITISREFGAGGGEIGRQVAERLNFDFYDKAVIFQAARNAGIDTERMVQWDEKVPALLGFGQSLFDFYNRPLDEKLFKTQTEIIRKMGEHGNCVIIGRNANRILHEFDHSLHVFIRAKKRWRIERLKAEKMQDSTEAKISDYLVAVDKTRRRYCQHYTNTEFGHADFYDLCLCSSSLGIEKCVELICNVATS